MAEEKKTATQKIDYVSNPNNSNSNSLVSTSQGISAKKILENYAKAVALNPGTLFFEFIFPRKDIYLLWLKLVVIQKKWDDKKVVHNFFGLGSQTKTVPLHIEQLRKLLASFDVSNFSNMREIYQAVGEILTPTQNQSSNGYKKRNPDIDKNGKISELQQFYNEAYTEYCKLVKFAMPQKPLPAKSQSGIFDFFQKDSAQTDFENGRSILQQQSFAISNDIKGSKVLNPWLQMSDFQPKENDIKELDRGLRLLYKAHQSGNYQATTLLVKFYDPLIDDSRPACIKGDISMVIELLKQVAHDNADAAYRLAMCYKGWYEAAANYDMRALRAFSEQIDDDNFETFCSLKNIPPVLVAFFLLSFNPHDPSNLPSEKASDPIIAEKYSKLLREKAEKIIIFWLIEAVSLGNKEAISALEKFNIHLEPASSREPKKNFSVFIHY